MRVVSPIPFAPGSPFSTGRYLNVEVSVPLIPWNRPVPLMISPVNAAAVGIPTAVPLIVPCCFVTIVEPSVKVKNLYTRSVPDPWVISFVLVVRLIATSPFSNTQKALRT